MCNMCSQCLKKKTRLQENSGADTLPPSMLGSANNGSGATWSLSIHRHWAQFQISFAASIATSCLWMDIQP